MKFPRLIILARLIPDAFPVLSRARDTARFQRRPVQKCLSTQTHSNNSEIRSFLIVWPAGSRELVLRCLSIPERNPGVLET
jgi:hypothetical protein